MSLAAVSQTLAALDPAWPSAALTAVLVAITGYYAYETRRMVKEMRQGRVDSIRPHLVLDYYDGSPGALTFEIRNVGAGPAVDVRALLSMPVKAGHDGVEAIQRPHRTAALGPGQRVLLVPWTSAVHADPPTVDPAVSLEEFAEHYEHARLTGSMRNALGDELPVDSRLDPATDPLTRADTHERKSDVDKLTEQVKRLVRLLEKRLAPPRGTT